MALIVVEVPSLTDVVECAMATEDPMRAVCKAQEWCRAFEDYYREQGEKDGAEWWRDLDVMLVGSWLTMQFLPRYTDT